MTRDSGTKDSGTKDSGTKDSGTKDSGTEDSRPTDASPGALVGIIMGSRSDWEIMQNAVEVLDELGIASERRVVSAHRTPEWMFQYAREAESRGLKVIIAGAGGAAHLPGMVASCTLLPVLGVPVQSRALQGLDSLLSIVQMPGGIPVGTLAIGSAGAKNAGLLAARMLATNDPVLRSRLAAWVDNQTQSVMNDNVL
jgi:5-(carboxyamino)imidazole ribonucleotide mutase